MPIKLLFDPAITNRPMRVAAFMSGSGTNIMRLIEHQRRLEEMEGHSPFEIIFIFSDRSDGECDGEKIALNNGLPYFSYDIRTFHNIRSIKRSIKTPTGLSARKDYDRVARTLVEAFEIDVVALGGYMSFITLNRCVNVHPADLSILTSSGERKYIGFQAVYDAILAGETELRSSTLWTDNGVDSGPLLMLSEAIKLKINNPHELLKKDKKQFLRIVNEQQERLKEMGDWQIFPKTIEMIARGYFAIDQENKRSLGCISKL